MTTMIALVGEQPIPNLLPVRYLEPESLLLVHTKRTEQTAGRLRDLMKDTETLMLNVQPYDIERIRHSIEEVAGGRSDLVFNLTGGTKIMAVAAYDLAAQSRSSFIYLQTEGRRGRDCQSVLYRYGFDEGRPTLEERKVLDEPLISLDDYLKVHFGDFEESPLSRAGDRATDGGAQLEQAVHRALEGYVDEIKHGVRPAGMKNQVETDLVIRCVNQIGFIEVKSGGEGSGKKAVDQLTTAGARELSGTYTARFLVTVQTRRDDYKALASQMGVSVVELLDYRGGRLSERDTHALRQRIAERLPCRTQP